MKKVKAEQAFRWFCPDCQTENFDRAQDVSSDVFEDAHEEYEAREYLGVEEGGSFVTLPDTVTCRECLGMYGLE